MRQPDRWTAKMIQQWGNSKKTDDGWLPARAEGHNAWGWKWRWKMAIAVLTGKADALFWD